MSTNGGLLMDARSIDRSLTRMAHEIVEANKGAQNLALVGIRTGGAHLAARLRKKIAEIEKVDPSQIPCGSLDITLYRDDLALKKGRPVLKSTNLDFDIHGKRIVLVDDVLYTGRTVRAALGALMDLGRPQGIQLAVLVDRGHRELPIRADYVGRNQPTSPQETLKLYLQEEGGPDELRILA